ncbi:MAG: helix-turn-helix domain-containing protein [Peptostreptococcaceae bacterium]|nr:helix-turn-helix domain-containing protein [Peptostreptococcaceae bacterium]
MEQKILTIEMAADKLGVHPKTVRRYISGGKISAQKVAGSWRINEDSLEQFLETCEVNESKHCSVSKDDFCVFMDSEYFDSDETIQICTIVDYYVQKEQVKNLLKDVMEVVADYSIQNCSSRFNYVYDDSENKMRLVFWGAPSYMSRVMNAMKPYEN